MPKYAARIDDDRLSRAILLMCKGYGREDIAVIDGDPDWVDRLFLELREKNLLLDAYRILP